MREVHPQNHRDLSLPRRQRQVLSKNNQTVKDLQDASAARGFSHHCSARWRPAASDDNRLTTDRLKCLAQTDHPGDHPIRRTEVHGKHVVLLMVEDTIKQRDQFSMPPGTEPALEHRQLQPLTMALHQAEHPSPALLVGDIIGDHVKVFFVHAQRVVKLGYSSISPSR